MSAFIVIPTTPWTTAPALASPPAPTPPPQSHTSSADRTAHCQSRSTLETDPASASRETRGCHSGAVRNNLAGNASGDQHHWQEVTHRSIFLRGTQWPWPWFQDHLESPLWTCLRGTFLCPCPCLCSFLRHSLPRCYPSPYCSYSLALRHPHSGSNPQRIPIPRKTPLPQVPIPHPQMADGAHVRKLPATNKTVRSQGAGPRLDVIHHHTRPGHYMHDRSVHHHPRISGPAPQDTTTRTFVHYTMPRGHTQQDELHQIHPHPQYLAEMGHTSHLWGYSVTDPCRRARKCHEAGYCSGGRGPPG